MGTFRIPVFPRRDTAKIIWAENVLIKDTWTTSHPHLVIKFAFDCWVWAWLVLDFNRQPYSKLMWTHEPEVSLLTAAHEAVSLLRGVPVHSTTLITFDIAIRQWQALLKIIQPLHLCQACDGPVRWSDCTAGGCLKLSIGSAVRKLFSSSAKQCWQLKFHWMFFPFKAVFKKKPDRWNLFVLIEICRDKEEDDSWPACLTYKVPKNPWIL